MIEVNFTNAAILDHTHRALVSFWAPWCSACKAQNTLLNNIDELPLDILLASIDVGENRYLAQKYAVANIPDLLLLEYGKTVKRFSQIQNTAQLINQLNNLK